MSWRRVRSAARAPVDSRVYNDTYCNQSISYWCTSHTSGRQQRVIRSLSPIPSIASSTCTFSTERMVVHKVRRQLSAQAAALLALALITRALLVQASAAPHGERSSSADGGALEAELLREAYDDQEWIVQQRRCALTHGWQSKILQHGARACARIVRAALQAILLLPQPRAGTCTRFPSWRSRR